MDLEIEIISNFQVVKEYLKANSSHYQEDFLINNIIFVTIPNLTILDNIKSDIIYHPEQYAFH